MDKIYLRARSVRMCVQDRSGPTAFSEYGQLFHSLQNDTSGLLNNVESPLFLVLIHLISLPYFQRAWVNQEVALARAAYLLVNNNELLLTPTVMDRLRSACKCHQFDVPGVLRWNPGQKIEADIITCLRIGIECKSSDARDKVYALLGLMEPHAQSLIPVDYSSGVESAYSNAVIAIIALQQSLDILRYASVLWDGLFSPDWRANPNMNLEQYRAFLFNTSVKGQCDADPRPDMLLSRCRYPQFEGQDSIGPWESTVQVKIKSATLNFTESYSQEEEKPPSCIIQRPKLGRLDILPRLHVRAHYIDSVEQIFLDAGKFARAILNDASLLAQKDYSPILLFFKSSRQQQQQQQAVNDLTSASPSSSSNIQIPPNLHLEHAQNYLPHVNIDDLLTFIHSTANRDGGVIFLGKYSVGIASHEAFELGDAVFAVDGVTTPLLLREDRSSDGNDDESYFFRVVGPCYVYAGMELDYWNEGSGKGRWGNGFYGPRNQQTRMIEIN